MRRPCTFVKANGQELETVNSQVERLARTRLWAETRDVIGGLYQRAFRAGNEMVS
jgi:hypothetical protein